MSEMIRKQIYISKRQDLMLKRLSHALGVSEAEIVRNAIDRELFGEKISDRFMLTPSALEDFIMLARSNRELSGEPMRWKRSEIYEQRENRRAHQVSNGDENDARVD